VSSYQYDSCTATETEGVLHRLILWKMYVFLIMIIIISTSGRPWSYSKTTKITLKTNGRPSGQRQEHNSFDFLRTSVLLVQKHRLSPYSAAADSSDLGFNGFLEPSPSAETLPIYIYLAINSGDPRLESSGLIVR
jgi:hypothetical protein